MSLDPRVFGKFQLTESENFDKFMEAVGVGYLTRYDKIIFEYPLRNNFYITT